jgi:hypothetical protein
MSRCHASKSCSIDGVKLGGLGPHEGPQRRIVRPIEHVELPELEQLPSMRVVLPRLPDEVLVAGTKSR